MMEQQFVRLSMFNIEKIFLKDESRPASNAKATVRHLRAEEELLLKSRNIPALKKFYIQSKEALEVLEESLHICTLVI